MCRGVIWGNLEKKQAQSWDCVRKMDEIKELFKVLL